ncbi:MAG: hypothetical protein HFE64_03390 [Lachnospiraceae bacterium]|jgi:hypothetical protein|nr:hypothetical protein [Lachnospiraceae bacterium]
MKKMGLNLQLFAAEENLIMATDMEPAISIDFASRLNSNISELMKLLGIVDLDSVPAGTTIDIYAASSTGLADQVGEGEKIKLTKVMRKKVKSITLELEKYRWATSAENIQKVGREKAINDTDDVVIGLIRKDVKRRFVENLLTGTGSATGTTLQATLAKSWAAVGKYFEDRDVTPIYFVSLDDVADYLSTAQIGLAQAFGFSYIENFLGLGTTIVLPALEKGKIIATAKENLRGVKINMSSGDVARTFGLTSDQTGIVGMKHYLAEDEATVGSLAMAGITFYPEEAEGVIVGTIGESVGLDNLTVTSVAGTNSGDTKITVSPALTSGNSYKYKVADNATLPAAGQNVRTWTNWDGSADITAATGKEIVIVECDADYKAVKGGVATVTAKE